jgi:hypothetical protein
MKSYISIALLVMAAGIATMAKLAKGFPANLQDVNIQFRAKDIAEHGLVVITPSDPEFAPLLASRFNGANPAVEALRPFAVLIKNVSTQPVVAYSLEWELTREDGKVFTQSRSYIAAWKLMGMKGSDDATLIKPNSFVVMTPSNFDVADYNGASEPTLLASLSTVRTELAHYTAIGITVDGAFFEDGSYVGPDSNNFFSRVEALLNAKRDTCLEILQSSAQGLSTEQIYKHLEDVAKEPNVDSSDAPTKANLYRKYKKDVASEILRTRSTSGDARAVEFATRLLGNKWPELRKL